LYAEMPSRAGSMEMHWVWKAPGPDSEIIVGKYCSGGLSLITRLVLPPMKARFAMSSASREVYLLLSAALGKM
jgi:hypothetical protein